LTRICASIIVGLGLIVVLVVVVVVRVIILFVVVGQVEATLKWHCGGRGGWNSVVTV
jgi:hypothetical protein